MPTVFNFEGRNPTVTPPFVNRPGSLTQISEGGYANEELNTIIKRGQTPFDIVSNIGQQAKTSEFGLHSLDPFFQEFDVTPFTLTIGTGERTFFLPNTVSVTMGDYGEDDDLLVLQAFDKNGTLLGEDRAFLPADGLNFTSRTLTVSSGDQQIQSIKFIGGTADRPNSVFYDNITFYAPEEFYPSAPLPNLPSNPYWDIGKLTDVAQDKISNIRKRISDILRGRGNHLIDELLKDLPPDRRQELREQIEVSNAILETARRSINNDFSNLPLPDLPPVLGKIREILIRPIDNTQIAINSFLIQGEIASTAGLIADATGRNVTDLSVLEAATALALGNALSNEANSVTPRRSKPKPLSQHSKQEDSSALNELSIVSEINKQVDSRNAQGSSKNDRLLGTTQDDRLFGKGGNDVLSGQQGWDILIGDIGKDRLVGGDGSDMLNGCGKKFIAGEVDRLTGGEDIDFFILGDPNRFYYDDRNRRTPGNKDFAVITDFNFNQDFLILKGRFSDYIFKRDKIFLNNDGIKGLSRNDELIAQMKGAANLNPIHIMFV